MADLDIQSLSGIDLDAAVARALGWTDVAVAWMTNDYTNLGGKDPSGWESNVPAYSTSLSAAWSLTNDWKSWRLDFDTDYGIDRRTGWSVHVNGCCLVQFAATAPVAICRAFLLAKGVLTDG